MATLYEFDRLYLGLSSFCFPYDGSPAVFMAAGLSVADGTVLNRPSDHH
jgi:hypothetical protein